MVEGALSAGAQAQLGIAPRNVSRARRTGRCGHRSRRGCRSRSPESRARNACADCRGRRRRFGQRCRPETRFRGRRSTQMCRSAACAMRCTGLGRRLRQRIDSNPTGGIRRPPIAAASSRTRSTYGSVASGGMTECSSFIDACPQRQGAKQPTTGRRGLQWRRPCSFASAPPTLAKLITRVL